MMKVEESFAPMAFFYGALGSCKSLDTGWQFCEIEAGLSLENSDHQSFAWRPATAPCTVAGLLRSIGELGEDAERGVDEREFLFRTRFRSLENQDGQILVFEGLATLTDIWLNGSLVLSTQNMFRRYALDVGQLLHPDNELVLHFRAVGAELARKRPRGRWVSRLAKHRNLRYLRTSLLGRMPGWASDHPPVGPWRAIHLVERRGIRLQCLSVKPALDGTDGVLAVVLRGCSASGDVPTTLQIRVGDCSFDAPVRQAGEEFEVSAEVRIPEVTPWWSHDLGTPHRYAVTLVLTGCREPIEIGTVKVGFRRIERAASHRPDDLGFALRLNNLDIFCRGACWTPVDPIGLHDDPIEIRRVLELVRDAGFNMLRLNGTMVYESESFYDACDEFGILVWQDFMFARMDYPEHDADFASEVRVEAAQVLARLHHRPCIAVLCGNSEVEQQAAMLGLAPEAGRTRLFVDVLAEASRRWCPGVPYVSSSPSGGPLPFHVDSGVAHYFGVGAYLRPLSDARESNVRFASECLAFSNIPEDQALDELFGEEPRSVHSLRYKRGVPRDPGAEWDFADVTDHYLEQLFGCNARTLREADIERYIALARIVPGEMMARTMGIWRAAGSPCRGALVWFLRDLHPGPGWGVLDSAGRPKAPYWFLKRACAPQATWFTDEGLNGLRLHVRNDGAEVFTAALRARLLQHNGVRIAAAETELRVEGHSAQALSVDAFVGGFSDTTWAYRFGPCQHVVSVAELVTTSGTAVSTAHHLSTGLAHELRDDIGLRAVVGSRVHEGHELRVESRELALFIRVKAPGFLPSDNYFHIGPGEAREIFLRGGGDLRPSGISITALNARCNASVECVESLS